MRTKELKIQGQKKEAILVAGGPGFKIYSVSGCSDWAVVAEKKIHLIEEKSTEYKIVGQYVNLKYQRIAEQQAISENFKALLKAKAAPVAETPQDSAGSVEPASDFNTNSF